MPREASSVGFTNAPAGHALALTRDELVVYDLPSGLPLEAGSLELLFRADFSQDVESQERTVLRISGENKHDLQMLYVPVSSVWRFRLQDSLFTHASPGRLAQGKWQHLLLTWNSSLEPRALTRFYMNGTGGHAYNYTPPKGTLTSIKLGGKGPLEVSIGALAVYNRALTQAQALFLAEAREKTDQPPYDALLERIAADDQAEAQRRALRLEQVARLDGRVGHFISMRSRQPHTVTYVTHPEGIEARGVRIEELGVLDLTQFLVIFFPQGAIYQIDPEQQQAIFDYVRNGGGYVGACAGAYNAIRMQPRLLNLRSHTFLGSALFPITLKPHPVTEGYGSQVTMHHGNGPIMFPLDDSRVIGTYPVPGDKDNPPGAIVVGRQGKGRVVLFGPHPRGGSIEAAGKRIHLSAAELGTDRMLVNALLYAAGIIGEDEEAQANNPVD